MSIESDAIQPSHPDSVCVCVCGEKERERWLLSSHPITQSCLTLFDPMDCSTAGLPVPQHLPGIAQVHIHCIGEGVQPSHPLKPSSPSALNLSQDQGLFHRVICSHQMTIILELQLQHQSFQRNPRADLLQNGLVGCEGYRAFKQSTACNASVMGLRTTVTSCGVSNS